jgi:hypothetical protein
MEAFGLYLIKSVVWITGFGLVYFLFLRNERFFMVNRLYLLSGILVSFFFPFISVHYMVDLHSVTNFQTGDITVAGMQEAKSFTVKDLWFLLTGLYITGVLVVALGLMKQNKKLINVIRKTRIIFSGPVKVIRTPECTSSFSFFSYVFVNPSISDLETNEIMNHEMAHIRQWHWFDLVLVELLCIMQWFNPGIWIYLRFIRQNHEYLADEVALQRTTDPAIYKAALLNQIVGTQVFSLSNSFNYSLNKKRFKMMKNIINSPYRKMKLLLILPVFAIVLYSFAKPEYKYAPSVDNSVNNIAVSGTQNNEVSGTVTEQGGRPLQGATVIVKGTTKGSLTDSKGSFRIGNIAEDGLLIVSYVGFKSKVVKPDFTSEMKIEMMKDTVKLGRIMMLPPPPPPASGNSGKSQVPPPPPPPPVSDKGKNANVPPPPGSTKIRNTSDGSPASQLFIVDGVISDMNPLGDISPDDIASMNVLKSENAINKYGEKAKNGAIEITMKKSDHKDPGKNEKTDYAIIEEMPQFPGGEKAIKSWIYDNIKVMKGAEKISGPIYMIFTVDSNGKIKDVKADKPRFPVWEAEVIRVISNMPDWKPGSQNGKPIDVTLQLPIDLNSSEKNR